MSAILLAWLCVAPLVPSCAVSAPTRETRAVSGISTVRLEGSMNLAISQGDSESLVIEGEPDDVRNVKAVVHDGVLTLSNEPPWWSFLWPFQSHATPRAILGVKSLNRIAVEGSGDVSAAQLVTQEGFSIAVAGSGEVRLKSLAARRLEVHIAGSGDVSVAGAVLEEQVSIAGSGSFAGGELKCASARVSNAGSGDATVWVRDQLTVSLAGSGEVSYYGAPVVKRSIVGSGTIRLLGVKS